ncbi:MAG: flagellar motor switch protein FliN [Armatimonadota bacterium]
MSVKPEIISKYNNAQQALWQSVTNIVSESVGYPITFSDPVSTVVPISDLYTEMATPKLVIQFAFAHEPENVQVLLANDDVIGELYQSVMGQKPGIIDDSKVSELRSIWESVVQGVCLAAGQIRNEAVVATSLTIRYQIFSFPASMQRVEDLFRTNVTFAAESLTSHILWLVETSSAYSLINVVEDENDLHVVSGSLPSANKANQPDPAEDSSLELLLDIPLDITVELGRLRMVVRDVVELGSGSIIELDKAAGEPVDVLVNGRLVARGEVVVIEDNFGVRITEILTPSERLLSLREAA